MGIKYTFQEKIWAHNGKGSWYFVSLPFDFSKEIRENLQSGGLGQVESYCQNWHNRMENSDLV